VDAFCPACREPYERPQPTEIALTSQQHALLVAYKQFRFSPPTVGKVLLRAVPVYLLLITMPGGVAGLCALVGIDTLAYVVTGVIVGALLRDLRWIVATVRAWPVVVEVIDWPRVDQLLAGDGVTAPDHLPQQTPPHDPRSVDTTP
jgi:hypothetical protein